MAPESVANHHGWATLDELRPGERAVITDLVGDEATRVLLMELGLLPGVPVRFVRRAPLGCPIEIDVSGPHFSLRCETARAVQVTRDV